MTMGDETLFGAMTLPVIIGPTLEQLEQKDRSAAQTLRSTLEQAEARQPGFSYDMLKILMAKSDIQGRVEMTECFLRLEAQNTSMESGVNNSLNDNMFEALDERCKSLKSILGRIPDQIHDRRRFLETIKDIASAIKNLLDAVNNVLGLIEGDQRKQACESRKRDFVRYSRKFSNTLKDFFKDNREQEVYYSAVQLIHQTNLIVQTVKGVST